MTPENRSGRGNILIVDDEVKLVNTLTLLLKSEGYNVSFAFDGMEALRKAREEEPDLIVLDLNLPKLDGLQICRMLKFDKKLSKIHIIMLTVRGEQEDKEWGKKVSADAYLTKPFDSGDLLETIENLLDRKE